MKALQGSFAAGLAAGAVVVGVIAVFWFLRDPPQPASAVVEAPAAEALQPSAAAAPTASVPPAQAMGAQSASSACAAEPGVPQGAAGDGQFNLQAALDSADTAPPSAFIAVAKEAADQGRHRDAEVALIAACRVTERSAPAPSAPLSRVMNLLGQHYVAVAGTQTDGELREALLARGRDLLDGSVRGYTAVLGAGASRTRDAAERLAAAQADPAPLQQHASLRRGDADADEQALQQRDGGCGPGPAHLTCRDADLQQLEADLGRLRAQAESVSRDPAGLQRRAAQAEARRDACTSRECLVRWYAQRRGELLAEFGSARAAR